MVYTCMMYFPCLLLSVTMLTSIMYCANVHLNYRIAHAHNVAQTAGVPMSSEEFRGLRPFVLSDVQRTIVTKSAAEPTAKWTFERRSESRTAESSDRVCERMSAYVHPPPPEHSPVSGSPCSSQPKRNQWQPLHCDRVP